MRIFLAGDHLTGTGPANVTQYYIDNLPENTLYQKQTSKLLRVPEIFINTLRADLVVYSGYSKQNILGMKLAAVLGKPSAYIMHGCVEYENQINNEVSEQMCRVERKTLELTDLILAVSPSFAKWLKENYPEHSDKIDFVINGIEKEQIEKISMLHVDDKRDSHMIFSIGGGMPRKKIKYICRAVEILRQEYDREMTLTLVGAKGDDSEEINSYPFVEDKGIVPFEETVRLFGKAAVFVQNSCFETFGLAPVEAVSAGCSTLMSEAVGALCLFKSAEEPDIIEKYDNPEEIALKIKGLIENSNADKLRSDIDWEAMSWKRRSLELAEKLQNLLK